MFISNALNNKWFFDQALLTPTNISVKEINVRLLNILPEEEKVYKSIDNISSRDQMINSPTEFLNSLEPIRTAPNNLLLKIGAPITLLRNLDPPELCNGTRLTIKRMMSHVLETTIISEKYAGVSCFIPRIPMKPTNLPFEFERLQFPVILCFAMTINKSQRQSLKASNHLSSSSLLFIDESRSSHTFSTSQPWSVWHKARAQSDMMSDSCLLWSSFSPVSTRLYWLYNIPDAPAIFCSHTYLRDARGHASF